ISCNYEKKVCDFKSENEELKIYNNILTEMIENQMHFRYLGGKEEEIWEKYYYDKDNPDTAKINNEITKAHNEIFNNPSKFCTLYLDTATRPNFYYDSIGFLHDVKFKTLITQYTENGKAAVDSLNGLQ